MRSGNVLPGFSALNLPYCEYTALIKFSKFWTSQSFGSNVQHRGSCENSSFAIFLSLIKKIASLVGNKQMVWTHTLGIVAAMCYYFILDIISKTSNPAMSQFRFTLANTTNTVARRQTAALPFPASIAIGFWNNFYLPPEPSKSHKIVCVHACNIANANSEHKHKGKPL